jgi:RecA-family ATPase
MLVLDDFHNLEKKVEDLKRDRDVAKGALQLLLRRLRKEFGCKTLKEAKELLKTLQAQERKAMHRYTVERKKFDQKWKGKI